MTLCLGCGEYYVPLDRPQPHAREEDDEHNQNCHRYETSSGGIVLWVAIVPEEFAVGEQVEHPQYFTRASET